MGYTVVLLMFGLLFSSTVVALFSTMTMQIVMMHQEHKQILSTLSTYLAQNHVRTNISARVIEQVKERLTNKKQLIEKDVPALSILSSSLRMQLFVDIYKSHITTHPLFQLWDKVDDSTLEALCCEAVDTAFYSAGEDVFIPGSTGDFAFYVVAGKLLYTQEPEYSAVTKTEATHVEAGMWICESALWSHWTHVGKLEALTACQLLLMHSAGLHSVLRKHF